LTPGVNHPLAPERTVVITDLAELRSYETEWRELAERRGNAFLTPEWFWSWMDSYRESVEPAVAATHRADGSLLGLMPLVVATTGRPRTLRFAGAAFADHLHPVCLPEDEARVASAAAAALTTTTGRWTLAVLDNIDTDSRWCQAFVSAPAVVGVSAYRDSVLPAIEFGPGGWDAYLTASSRNFREQARRLPRRLERVHRVSYRRTADESELDRDMRTFFALHDERWSARGGSSLKGARARIFLHHFARSALGRGWLRLWFLELDDVAVAAWYGWRVGDTYGYYQAGFDPKWSHMKVGFVLMVHTVHSAIDEGAGRYDMLLGDEAYKSRFGNTVRPVHTVTLSNSQPARIAAAAEAMLWRASRKSVPGLGSFPPALKRLLPTARRP
jgi:CelD/BcsL family acetyltransferase involved in cellulose biosynthesis